MFFNIFEHSVFRFFEPFFIFFRLSEIEASHIFGQIIEGMEHLQSLNIAHRNIVPESIVLDAQKNIKIVNFGLSTTYEEGELRKSIVGVPCFLSPEILRYQLDRPDAGCDFVKAEIWSSGILLYSMLCGRTPFEDPSCMQVYQNILAGVFEIPDHVSEDAKDLLRRLLTSDPAQRIDFAGIRKHPWFRLRTQKTVADQNVLNFAVEKYGLDAKAMRADVESGEMTKLATTYYLLEKEFIGSDAWAKPSMSPDGI